MIARHMVMRVACGLCVIGAAELSALAATSTDDSTQNDVNGATISLDQTPAKDAPARAQSGNPLWAITLSSLSITRDRPLFTPSRRPLAPASVAVPRVVEPRGVARPIEPGHSNLMLIGTVVGKTESIGVFLDQTTHEFIRLRTGEGHAGWFLLSIKAREATLKKEQRTEMLSLPAAQDANSSASTPDTPGPDQPVQQEGAAHPQERHRQ